MEAPFGVTFLGNKREEMQTMKNEGSQDVRWGWDNRSRDPSQITESVRFGEDRESLKLESH